MVERTDEREAERSGTEADADLDADVDVDIGDSGVDGLDGDFGVDDDVGLDEDIGLDGDVGVDPAAGPGDASGRTEEADSGLLGSVTGRVGGAVSRVPNPVSGVFSLRSFALSLVLVVAAMVGAGAFVPLPFSGFLGVFLVALLLGLVGSRSRYLELGVAAAGAAGVSLLVQRFFFALVGNYGTEIAAMGAGAGLVAALLGHYFGRDIRDGLTREV